LRNARIQTTMNVYGRAMTDSKRQAHDKVVQMVLKVKPAKAENDERPTKVG
jgi:integrase